MTNSSRVDALAVQVREWDAAGCDGETIIQNLRDAGLSKSDATVAFSRSTRTPRADAIRVVHHSNAYADRRAADEVWNNALWDLLEKDEFVSSLSPAGEYGADDE